MTAETAPLLMILVLACIFGLFAVIVSNIKQTASKDKNWNTAINNIIIDLYEAGYILPAGEKGNREVTRATGTASISDVHTKILDAGFKKDVKLSTREFHSNIYQTRTALINLVENNPNVDTLTKPSNRIYSDKADSDSMVVLPLLILGTPEGSHFAGNPAYAGTDGYVGTSDFGGGDSSGGDGGGDGGD